MRFEPGPGMGGHCLPVDPFYLTWRAREFEMSTEFIELAGKINQQMPHYCVERIERALNDVTKPVKGSKIAILGVSYKGGVGDIRESPALRIIRELAGRGADLAYHDPFVPSLEELGLQQRPPGGGGRGRRRGRARHRAPGHRPRGDRTRSRAVRRPAWDDPRVRRRECRAAVACAGRSRYRAIAGGCAVAGGADPSTARSATGRTGEPERTAAPLITEPQEGIAPLLAAIRGARRSVQLVMYEDEDAQVDSALASAHDRGVKVQVLLNGGYYGEGSSDNEPAYRYLRAHRVAVRWTPPYFALTHQKSLVVDGRAYILTFNLTPQYYASDRDFGVIDRDAADVSAIERAFAADWVRRRIAARTART